MTLILAFQGHQRLKCHKIVSFGDQVHTQTNKETNFTKFKTLIYKFKLCIYLYNIHATHSPTHRLSRTNQHTNLHTHVHQTQTTLNFTHTQSIYKITHINSSQWWITTHTFVDECPGRQCQLTLITDESSPMLTTDWWTLPKNTDWWKFMGDDSWFMITGDESWWRTLTVEWW